MKLSKKSPEKENTSGENLNRYTFEINCEGMIRTTTIAAESKPEAEKIVKRENPGCDIKLKWMHE